jgi:hypothetical protein
MIYVGIDDTDLLDTPGTNQLARALADRVASHFLCHYIIRHQLLEDPRVPCTSKNGCASILLESRSLTPLSWLIDELRAGMRERYVSGSDPGLCVVDQRVPAEVIAWGERCCRELVSQDEALALAAATAIHLEGLGGTNGGVIGALAAVGRAATGNDGRIVRLENYPDDLSGTQSCDTLRKRGVSVWHLESDAEIVSGTVDVGKHLRPSFRRGQAILFVERPESPSDADWLAVRLK